MYFTLTPIDSSYALFSACILALLFVASLYVWRWIQAEDAPHDRDHPQVIKQRLLAILIVLLLSTIPMYILAGYINKTNVSRLDVLLMLVGIPTALPHLLSSYLHALLLPLLHISLLFLGPLLYHILLAIYTHRIAHKSDSVMQCIHAYCTQGIAELCGTYDEPTRQLQVRWMTIRNLIAVCSNTIAACRMLVQLDN